MRLKIALPTIMTIALAGALSYGAATVAAEKIEVRARADISQALRLADLPWVRLDVDGLQVALSGSAPDEAARFAALAAAGTVVDATRVLDRMDVAPTEDIDAPAFSVEILRNLDGVSLIGLVPPRMDREDIAARISNFAGVPVTDLLEVGNYPTPRTWDAAVDYAIEALELLPRSKISVSATRVAITGIVDSEQMRRQVESALTRAVPSGVTPVIDISAPRPVIAPFTVRFLIDADGARFDACAADTEEAKEAIIAAATAAGYAGPNACQIGLGTPSLDWANAVAAGIGALKEIGQGSVTFSDTKVSLVAPHTTPLPAFDREAGELERALPEGFSLTAVRNPPPETERGASDEDQPEIPEFNATLSPEGNLQLRGRLSSEQTRKVVESYAHARFGKAATYEATRLDDSLPDGWSLRVMAALDALSYLNHGSVLVRPETLTIQGDSGREEASAAIAGLLSERLSEGADYEIKVTYVEALDPLAGLPTPEECVAQLNTVLEVQKITFEPGSASIDTAGLSVIENLAEVLRTCQAVKMEIGGHTDSQGRETMNQNLSQERANAVLNAIMARRVLTSNLTAKGYGETVPIADNGTEAGREANRRIEFTLIQPPEPDDLAEAEGNSTPDPEAETDEQN